MKNSGIPKWIEETLFQCDITQESYNYKELYVVWYDKIDRENPIRIVSYDHFMLVKQGKGFELIKNSVDEWSLSSRSLEQVLKENVVLFFTDFLVVDSIHSGGNFEKETNLKSWTELFRRLSIPYYEFARHRLKEAKQMDDFFELTEFELLQTQNLSRFMNSLE
jgi:hypothetical protein